MHSACPVATTGFEELCHLVTDADPDTALCGKDVTGYPWNPPWPACEACLAVAPRGDELSAEQPLICVVEIPKG